MEKLQVQLAKEFTHGMSGSRNDTTAYKQPPLGWYMSEKFDGYRALFKYNSEGVGEFYSRAGKRFMAPEWFLDAMPSHRLLGDNILDGELWAGRDNFQAMGIVRKKIPIAEEWTRIQYQVYDITNSSGTFTERLKQLYQIVHNNTKIWDYRKRKSQIESPYRNLESPLIAAEQIPVKTINDLTHYYKQILDAGGEGIMLKHPIMPYSHGRSSYMLKYKPVFDREAIIIDHKQGEGKYKGMLGAFVCRPLINHDTYMTVDMDDNHIFTLSGMDDSIRSSYLQTHPVDTVITYECSGYTDKGKPRFGRYLRIREDVVIKQISNDSTESLKRVKEIFKTLETHYQSVQDTFRAKSYRTVNLALRNIQSDAQLTDGSLQKVKGIGSGTLDKIRSILETGTCEAYEKIKLSQNSPKQDFLKIHGVGVQKANSLVKQGFKSIQDLREKGQDHLNDVQKLGLHYYEDIQQRIPYKEIVQHEIYLKQVLHSVDKDAELTIAGSYRRKKPTSGDIDLLVKGKTKKTYELFVKQLISQGYLVCTFANGSKKFMGMGILQGCKVNRRIDIMYTKPQEYPFAILYFTGSSEFNQRMRSEVLQTGLSINEYSLKDANTKQPVKHVFHTEKDIFDYLQYEYVEPWDRKS
uniref:ATP-dependent DNA ligase family profile domain-containing protein n=1 Tax=viral metagenome TaxID=1070528 RepID=A0A6C0F523_9ZZZZ|tara:strand:+ start:10310 stop:12214 length:1905 start_codon:yes stop_codon:yes gene_type:complete